MGDGMTDTEISLLAKAIAKELYDNGISLTAEYREVVTERNIALAKLASLQSRLETYEEGLDPAVKMPKEGETVIALYPNGDISRYVFSHKLTIDFVRWYPLPGSKGGEE